MLFVEDKEFKKEYEALRPGYEPISKSNRWMFKEINDSKRQCYKNGNN